MNSAASNPSFVTIVLQALNGGFDGHLLLTLDGAQVPNTLPRTCPHSCPVVQIQAAAELQPEPVLLDAGFGNAVAHAGCHGLPPFAGAVFAPPVARRSLGRCAVVHFTQPCLRSELLWAGGQWRRRD